MRGTYRNDRLEVEAFAIRDEAAFELIDASADTEARVLLIEDLRQTLNFQLPVAQRGCHFCENFCNVDRLGILFSFMFASTAFNLQ